jgi:hypothetical protein
MANRLKGEVAVEVGEGEGRRTLIFRLGINELIGLQDTLGMKDDDERFLQVLDNLRGLKRLRSAVRAALIFNQPDTTDEQAGIVITELGPAKVGELIGEALLWAMPDKSDTPAGPPKGKGAAASPGMLPS